ncbi:hypothetical protein RSAG8_09315, partial [Rhizoctonia solani AG-8 WAC10335]
MDRNTLLGAWNLGFIQTSYRQDHPLKRFHDPPIPQLQMAVLRSVPNACLFRHIGLFQLTELTYLELDFCSPLPELVQLNGLLVTCPRLTALFLNSMLDFHFDSVLDHSEEPVELPRVRLPMLRSLALKHTIRTTVLWELGILKMIDAPNVQSLQLYITSNRVFDSSPIIEYITQGEARYHTRPQKASISLYEGHQPRAPRVSRVLALKHTIRTTVLWELGILKMIDAPNVQSLQLYITSNRVFDSSPIIEYITQGEGLASPGPIFPLLTSLGFFLQQDITPDLRKLLLAYTRVTNLVLPEFPELTALLGTPCLAPNLTLLSLETKEYETLKELITLRRDARLPLKIVELKKQTSVWEISSDEQKELQGLVDLVMVDELEDRMFTLLMAHTNM